MQYDPIKDRLGTLADKHPALKRAFYGTLNLVFLRTWYVKRELRRILASMKHKEAVEVLDAGTGFAQYAYFIAKNFPHTRITAVDIKEDYLDSAQRFFRSTPQAHQVEFQVEDLMKLTLDGPFDLILSVDVMEHIEDDRAVFRHFERVLRPGGYVIINTPSDLGGSDVHGEDDASFIDEHVRDGYNILDLEAKLREAGLDIDRSMYTYGPPGSAAWRMLIKVPITMMDRTRAALVLLPLYYVFALPIGTILNWMDTRRSNEEGTGVLVIARKPS